MHKLLQYLNEFTIEKGRSYRFTAIVDSDRFQIDGRDGLGYETVFSKKFEFIAWLCNNGKINRKNRDLLDDCMDNFERYPIDMQTIDKEISLHIRAIDMLLMLLSIQDEPVNYLIDILK